MSGSDLVRVELHVPGEDVAAWVEETPEGAAHKAWMILDSARRACDKAGRSAPPAIVAALRELAAGGLDRP